MASLKSARIQSGIKRNIPDTMRKARVLTARIQPSKFDMAPVPTYNESPVIEIVEKSAPKEAPTI